MFYLHQTHSQVDIESVQEGSHDQLVRPQDYWLSSSSKIMLCYNYNYVDHNYSHTLYYIEDK